MEPRWDYERKEWGNEAYTILEFKVEPEAVPYVMPVVRRVLRAIRWDGGGTVSTRLSLSLF